jgi:hypothetical protein
LDVVILARRGFIGGLIGLIAAPAIVKASSLMPVKADLVLPSLGGNNLLTVDMITRESIRMFCNTNAFLKNYDRQFDEEFAVEDAKIGSTLRIRLPNDYLLSDANNGWQWPNDMVRPSVEMPQLSAPEMADIGAAAVLTKNPAVSRRFWGG